jgi:hypothetical protein
MELLLWTVVIFLARVVDVGLGTIRVQFIVRRKKLPAALIGFVEVLIFILIVSRVIQDIQHWPYVLAYAGGFATGTILGMSLTEKLSRRVVQATVICHRPSDEVETAVREAGFATTHPSRQRGKLPSFPICPGTGRAPRRSCLRTEGQDMIRVVWGHAPFSPQCGTTSEPNRSGFRSTTRVPSAR